jgi:2-methylisocitrate lyase-like PEP mutase family enzyme
MSAAESVTDRFRALHVAGTFVMPNPFDAGSARLLAALGFPALATTSSGCAASLGRLDMQVTRDEMLRHVEALVAATDVPVSVDAERCFGDTPDEVAQTVRSIADAGAAGCSIEDWDPVAGAIDPFDVAVERVASAAAAARDTRLVLTARCEHLLHGVLDLDDTIRRLCAYRDAGAEAVYAPGLTDLDQIRRVVDETRVPVNVLLLPGGPSVGQLADAGVRRVSVGGALAHAAYGAVVATARAILDEGLLQLVVPRVDRALLDTAFSSR